MQEQDTTRVCPTCQRTVTVRAPSKATRFCSRPCFAQSRKRDGPPVRRPTASKVCDQCGQPFAVWPHQVNDPRKRFCSQTCTYQHRREHTPRGPTAPCGICGKATPSPNWRLRIKPVVYCSPACGAIGRTTGQWLPCDGCGDMIYVHKKRAILHRQFYCSMACRNVGFRARWTRTRRSAAYQDWRHNVMLRDGFACARCGDVNGPLHAHHIKHWARYVDLRFEVSNGLTLCRDCHAREHDGEPTPLRTPRPPRPQRQLPLPF